MKNTISILSKVNACRESLVWAMDEADAHYPEGAWYSCLRGDWMLWIAEKIRMDRKKIFLVKAIYAHSIIQHMDDQRSRDAVRAVLLYGLGKITRMQLKEAHDQAEDVVQERDYQDMAANAAHYISIYPVDDKLAPNVAHIAVQCVAEAEAFSHQITYTDTFAFSKYKKASMSICADICRKVVTVEFFEKLKNYEDKAF
jgi:hypothetical protein